MFQRLKMSWEMTKESARLLQADRELMVFPIVSGVAVALVSASFLLPVGLLFGSFDALATSGPLGWMLGFLFYFLQYTVIFFFNSALVGAVMIRLDGGDPTVSDGLAIARRHLVPILGYAAIAATVGLLLKAGQNRSKSVGKVVTGILGVAWTAATYLVVPVLVTRDIGPVDAIRESAALLKKSWGEQIGGTVGIGLIFGLFSIVWAIAGGGLALLAAQAGGPVAFFSVVVLVALGFLALGLVKATLSGIFSAVLYRYATTGATSTVAPRLLEGAVRAG